MRRMNPTSCLFGSRFACAQTAIFSAEPCSKNAGETWIVLWITLLSKKFQHPAIQTKIEHHYGQIFSSNKSVPANRKTGFYANRNPNKQVVGFIFSWSRTLKSFQIFKSEIKKLKNYRGLCFFQGLSSIHCYHSHVDPIWPDGTLNVILSRLHGFQMVDGGFGLEN